MLVADPIQNDLLFTFAIKYYPRAAFRAVDADGIAWTLSMNLIFGQGGYSTLGEVRAS